MTSPLGSFLEGFGLSEESLGTVTRFGRRCFLTMPEQEPFILRLRKELYGAGIYLGEEKDRLAPSPALIELVAARTREHTVVVEEQAAWLFLCGRDILRQGVVSAEAPTASGLLLVQNSRGENLGYGQKGRKDVAVENLLDRGHFLRRERHA